MLVKTTVGIMAFLTCILVHNRKSRLLDEFRPNRPRPSAVSSHHEHRLHSHLSAKKCSQHWLRPTGFPNGSVHPDVSPSFILSRNVLTYLILATRTSIIIPTLARGSTHNSRGRRIAFKTVAHVNLHHCFLMDHCLESFDSQLFYHSPCIYIFLSRIPYIIMIISSLAQLRIQFPLISLRPDCGDYSTSIEQMDRIGGD